MSSGTSAQGNAAREVLDGELWCIRCRYELRGLPAEGRCPECGELVRASIAARDLAGRVEAGRVRRGCVLLLWSAVFSMLVGVFFVRVFAGASIAGSGRSDPDWVGAMLQALALPGWVCSVAGWWLMIVRARGSDGGHATRDWLGLSTFVLAMTSALGVNAAMVAVWQDRGPLWLMLAAGASPLVSLGKAVCVVFSMARLARLHPPMAGVIRRTGLLCGVLVPGGMALILIAGFTALAGAGAGAGVILVPALIGGVGVGLVAHRTLWGLRRSRGVR